MSHSGERNLLNARTKALHGKPSPPRHNNDEYPDRVIIHGRVIIHDRVMDHD